MEEKKYSKKWSGKGKTTVNREPITVNQASYKPKRGKLSKLMTGWAQVTGFRGETKELWQMEGRVERDIWYIEHWSIWLDFRIIWLTAKSIFIHDKNAY